MSTPPTETSTINLPHLLAVALVGFLAIRWYLAKPTSPTTTSTSTTSNTARSTTTTSGPRSPAHRQPDPAQIAHLASMFPQLDRRTLAWDLTRNGGSVAATSERVLSGRGLEAPPTGYRPRVHAAGEEGGVGGGAGVAGAGAGAGGGKGGARPDLISRYGLQGRVGGKGKERVESEGERREREGASAGGGPAWSANKEARAEGLKRRREEMVLAARRRMEGQQ